jgi:hypothetical protein
MSFEALKKKTKPANWTTVPGAVKRKHRAGTQHQYRKQAVQFLTDNPSCQLCGARATTVHHKQGRGQFLLDQTTWMCICMPCHRKIHDEPKWAMEVGYLLSRLNHA